MSNPFCLPSLRTCYCASVLARNLGDMVATSLILKTQHFNQSPHPVDSTSKLCPESIYVSSPPSAITSCLTHYNSLLFFLHLLSYSFKLIATLQPDGYYKKTYLILSLLCLESWLPAALKYVKPSLCFMGMMWPQLASTASPHITLPHSLLSPLLQTH